MPLRSLAVVLAAALAPLAAAQSQNSVVYWIGTEAERLSAIYTT